MISILTLVAGLILLVVAGDYLVRGAVGLAERLAIDPLIIGLTVVAFGTSAPELFVSLQAALHGESGIAIGNVVGSNIANVLLVMGAPALLMTIHSNEKGIGVSLIVMVLITAVLMAFMASGQITRLNGAVLMMMMFGYLGWQLYSARRCRLVMPAACDREAPAKELLSTTKIVVFIAGGLIGLPLGAGLTVEAASAIARMLGASETVIGLTVVAIGTSLPELVTSVMAACRRSGAVAIGNVVGSNIFNIGLILGLTGVILPLDVDPRVIHIDMWVMTATALLVVALAHWSVPIKKFGGIVMLAAFGIYIFSVF